MNGKNISTVIIKDSLDFANIKLQTPYACLVYSTESVKKEAMEKISDWLISSGCRSAVCAGVDCSIWHDAIDWAYIESDSNHSPSESRFVMTSWHETEALKEIVWFWLMCTFYDDGIFEHYLLLIIGEPESLEVEISNAINEIDDEMRI